jgi:hypothetical protein
MSGEHFRSQRIRPGTCHRQLRCDPSKRCRSRSSGSIERVCYPSPDAQLGEHLYPDKKTIADKLSVVIEESIRKQYSAGVARRDAHPKAYGCVKAEIRIVETLPAALGRLPRLWQFADVMGARCFR